MEHRERLAKVESIVDEHKQRMDRIERDISRIYASIDALRDHTDRGLAELRTHTDHGLAELREHTDRGLAEIHQELQRTTRWLIGLSFGYGIAILGMLGRMANLY